MNKINRLILIGAVVLAGIGCIEFKSSSPIVKTKVKYWSGPVPDYYITEYNSKGIGFRGVACSKALKGSPERVTCSNAGYDYD